MAARLDLMRVGLWLALLVMGVSESFAQSARSGSLGVAAGLGVSVVNATDVVDYINSVSSSAQRIDDFASAPEFFGTAEFRLTNELGAKLEYSYLLKSYIVGTDLGDYDYTYRVHMPTLLVQYLISDTGYAVKFGGGAGYHFATFSRGLIGPLPQSFKSSGLGFKLEAEGNTSLGGNLYGYVTADFRLNVMSTIKDAMGITLRFPTAPAREVKLNFFSLGLKFGLMYYFF
jgi:hypothetical protein